MIRPQEKENPSRREAGGVKTKLTRKRKHNGKPTREQVVKQLLGQAAMMPPARGKAVAMTLYGEGIATFEEVKAAFARNPAWRDA